MANNLLTMKDREQDQSTNPFLGMPKEQLEALEAQIKQRSGGGGSDILGRLATGAETAGDIFLGLGGAKTGGVSQLDELIKLETFKTKQAIQAQTEELNRIKIEAAQKKLESEAPIIKGVQETPPLAQRDITVGGQQIPTEIKPVVQEGVLPTDVQPDAVIQTQQLDEVFKNLPSGNAEEALSAPQITGFPTLDSLVQEIGNIPLTLDTVRETVDNTGKKSITTSKSINPLVTTFLEAKLRRQGKLDDVQLKILEKGLQERALNTRNSDAIQALLQNNTAVWKAAKIEKEGVPDIPLPGGRKAAILKRVVGKVAGALDITGFSWTKAYVGQRFETAMALSKIITGGARIIKSVIQALLKTLPVDNGIVDDMEALTTQSISNSVARATGRPLTKEEMQARDVRIVGVLDTEAASVPQGQQIRDSRIVVVNGIRREVKYKDFENFLDVLDENDTLEFPDLEPTE